MTSPTRLCLLPFLQSWDGASLSVRLVVIPRDDPTAPLAAGLSSFAEAGLTFEARIIRGAESLPTLGAADHAVAAPTSTPADRGDLFARLAGMFPIDATPPPPVRPAPTTSLRKYLPLSFRDAARWTPGRSPVVVTDDSYFCMLKQPPARKTLLKKPPGAIPWGKVIGIALRQPRLAEALGLIRPFDLPVPEDLADGGWLYCTLAPGTPYEAALGADPAALKVYAARVPLLGHARALFSPVLFPVPATPPPGSYDELFAEVMEYEDGFAKVVHAIQPRATIQLREEPDDTGPVNDVGIRLGWDDEQVAIWLARQMEPAGMALDAPLGVLGYRVDVREAGTTGWASLCRAAGDVVLGDGVVAHFDGEHAFEVHPVQHDADPAGTFWLNMYFATWSGPSLVGKDELQATLCGQTVAPRDGAVRATPPPVTPRYGRRYEFRVRLADLSGGGPPVDALPVVPAPAPIGAIDFRRWVRPRPLEILDPPPAEPDPAAPPGTITVRRPLLGHPMVLFTGMPGAEEGLLADLPAAKAAGREVGLPDPDVVAAQIEVQVRMPGFDPSGGPDGFRTVYTATREFPPGDDLVLPLSWQDEPQVDELEPAANGPLPLPTARHVRLRLRAVGRDVAGYFGTAECRFGPWSIVRLRAESTHEHALLRKDPPARRLCAMLLRPEPPADGLAAELARAVGRPRESAGAALERVAETLDLEVDGMTLRAGRGRRLVFGCTASVPHVLGPDAATLRVSSKSDLYGQWLMAVRATVLRDWSWDGLDTRSFTVWRSLGGGDPEIAGHIDIPPTVNPAAAADTPDRSQTDLVFVDAVDPKDFARPYPREIRASYHLEPFPRGGGAVTDAGQPVEIRLPITTPPAQIPKLVSAGVALEPYVRARDYSHAEPRRRHLWLEFDRPVDDPDDALFCRILGYGPDPELIEAGVEIPESAESPLPIDPEPIRVIRPGQPADSAGLSAMTALRPGAGSGPARAFYLMPLPPGIAPHDDELFGFFTYEIRVGHAGRWSTAQGRFGTPLRVTGVQHAPPPLGLDLRRGSAGIIVTARYANPVHDGRPLQPAEPRSEIWVLLYARVRQADGMDWRNVLIARRRATTEALSDRAASAWPPPDRTADAAGTGTAVANAIIWAEEIDTLLRQLTLPRDAPLTCLGVELLPNGDRLPDPLGADLGHQRIMRTSALVSVPGIC